MEYSGSIELEARSVQHLHLLVGKLITTQVIPEQEVIDTLLKLWITDKAFHMTPWGDNHFCFSFKTKHDMNYIEDLSPWFIRGSLMVLRRWESHQAVSDIDFSHCPLWVQIHGLPLNLMTKQNATLIGSTLGSVLFAEDFISEDGTWVSQFLRIRVLVDITKPLRMSLSVTQKTGAPLQINLQYERLSDYCDSCGCISHGVEDCSSLPHGPPIQNVAPDGRPLNDELQYHAKLKELIASDGQDFFTSYDDIDEIYDTFDAMGLQENLLRGIYGSFSKVPNSDKHKSLSSKTNGRRYAQRRN